MPSKAGHFRPMPPTTTLGILTAKGIEEVAMAVPGGGRVAVLVGFTRRPWRDAAEGVADRERREIARTYARLGCEVYRSVHDPRQRPSRANRRQNGWPNDLYVTVDGIVIPARGALAELGKGGNYVLGEDFVLVSRDVADDFRRQERDHAGFRRAFGHRRVYFIEPYELRLQLKSRVKTIRCGHLDLTIGYVPGRRLLTIADLHHAAIAGPVRAIARRHGLRVQVTAVDPPLSYHAFVNNYFVLRPGRSDQVVVANRFGGFDRWLCARGVTVRSPRLPVIHLPVFRGAIKCVSNQAPSPELFDHLGLAYERLRLRDTPSSG